MCPIISGGSVGGSSSTSGALAYAAAATTLDDSAVLPIDTADYDTDSYLNVAGSRLIVPRSGIYLFGMKLFINLPVATLDAAAAVLGFSNPVGFSVGPTYSRVAAGLGSWVVESVAPIRCNAGDYVTASAQFRTAGNAPINGVTIDGINSVLWVAYQGAL